MRGVFENRWFKVIQHLSQTSQTNFKTSTMMFISFKQLFHNLASGCRIWHMFTLQMDFTDKFRPIDGLQMPGIGILVEMILDLYAFMFFYGKRATPTALHKKPQPGRLGTLIFLEKPRNNLRHTYWRPLFSYTFLRIPLWKPLIFLAQRFLVLCCGCI